MTSVNSCPCDSGQAYSLCCGQAHRDPGMAVSAEALMRSRYSAFVLCLEDYLIATWHPSTRPAIVDCDPLRQWLGLKILSAGTDPADDRRARVEFVARSRLAGGRADRLHETSRFVKENEQWFYLDGDIQSKEKARRQS